eukprot:933733-Pleurochrysis_carterae.AAC.2
MSSKSPSDSREPAPPGAALVALALLALALLALALVVLALGALALVALALGALASGASPMQRSSCSRSCAWRPQTRKQVKRSVSDGMHWCDVRVARLETSLL